jgi:hypothetical protein
MKTSSTMPTAPAPRSPPPLLRRHTVEGEMYNNARSIRRSERVVPGRIRHDYETEAAIHAPLTTSGTRRSSHRHRREPPKDSVLAGLTGSGRGMNRVFEWRTFVQPGVPDDEEPSPPA